MKKIYVILVAVLITLPMFAGDAKPRIAVFDPTSSRASIDDGTKIAIREIISSTIVNAGNYDIVERSLLEKVMQEQQFSNSGVVDDGDATEIGKLAGANKIVLSVVTATGGRNMLSVKMIDVKTASVEKQKTDVVKPTEVLSAFEAMTKEMVGVEEENEEKVIKETKLIRIFGGRKSKNQKLVGEEEEIDNVANFAENERLQSDERLTPPTPGVDEIILYLPPCQNRNKLKDDKVINVYIDKESFGGGTYNNGFALRINKNFLKNKKNGIHDLVIDGLKMEFDENRENYYEFQSFQKKGAWKDLSLKEKRLIR